MFSKSQIITIPVLISSVLLLTGCPPPASFTQWKRASTSVEGVKAAMAECGDPVAGPQNHFPINEQIIHFQCMQRLGFTRKDGFEYCDIMKNMPACVEERQGRPLSLSSSKRCRLSKMKHFTQSSLTQAGMNVCRSHGVKREHHSISHSR